MGKSILTCGPETADRRVAGKLGRELNDTPGYAELIPSLDHS